MMVMVIMMMVITMVMVPSKVGNEDDVEEKRSEMEVGSLKVRQVWRISTHFALHLIRCSSFKNQICQNISPCRKACSRPASRGAVST